MVILLQACINDPLPRPRPDAPEPTVSRAYVSGNVVGVVKDMSTKAPLPLVKVTYDTYYSRPFEPYFDAFLINAAVPGTKTTSTNQQGEFSFSYSYPSVLASPDAIDFEFEIACNRADYKPFFRVFTYSIDNRFKRDTIPGGTYQIEVLLEQ